ncbi:MAG TPA: hypothetical protein VG871_00635, partial [Vicinamibacterales bacterium]|nr:hypothetical protein [Vicinamibacterales bacterium]
RERLDTAHPFNDRVAVTAAGLAVLRAERDWLSLDPPPRWVGGVQIRPGEPVWRWDAKREDIVRA